MRASWSASCAFSRTTPGRCDCHSAECRAMREPA
jgi:hypothetical protein